MYLILHFTTFHNEIKLIVKTKYLFQEPELTLSITRHQIGSQRFHIADGHASKTTTKQINLKCNKATISGQYVLQVT